MTKLDYFERDKSRFAANRLLLNLLSDDEKRAQLYESLRAGNGALKFQSRADTKERSWEDKPSEFAQDVYLLAEPAAIKDALQGEGYSNAPYRMLGSGNFMLGLDGGNHKEQREFAEAYLRVDPVVIRALANVAFQAAAALPLKQRRFDLAELAEQAAVRFVGFLFGFEQADHALIEQTMRSAYRGLNFVILGRHFVSEPGTIDAASQAMGKLLIRVGHLIDLYGGAIGREETEEAERIELELKDLQGFVDKKGGRPLEHFLPVLQRVAGKQLPGDKPNLVGREFSGAQLAMIVVGLIAGTIGNVQASVCMVINELFRHRGVVDKAHELALKSFKDDRDYDVPVAQLDAWTWEALRLNPPAAFLPRRTTKVVEVKKGGVEIPADRVVILAIGSASRAGGAKAFDRNAKSSTPHSSIFGDGGLHQCVGRELAMPLIARIVRQVLALPKLAETVDAASGEVRRLEKLWGFNCQKYPLEYNCSQLLVQSPLIVIMRVKTPLSEHAEALKKVIKYGAPRIEKKLRDSGHVHFASFVFLENDAKLALYTVYDRDFDAYIEYFAREVGPLFDRIFEHIQDAPPMPVNKFPKEFVETIRRYDAGPAADYFFSAYPTANVSMVTNDHPPEGP